MNLFNVPVVDRPSGWSTIETLVGKISKSILIKICAHFNLQLKLIYSLIIANNVTVAPLFNA